MTNSKPSPGALMAQLLNAKKGGSAEEVADLERQFGTRSSEVLSTGLGTTVPVQVDGKTHISDPNKKD